MSCCVVFRACVLNLSKLSVSMCGGHAGRLSVWWMWCYRSTKDLCCPIQRGIQDRISSMWRGLWCICASGCLNSANRKGLNGWPQLSADSSIVWGQFVGAGFVHCILGSASPPSRLIWVSRAGSFGQHSGATLAWNWNLCEALSCITVIHICF